MVRCLFLSFMRYLEHLLVITAVGLGQFLVGNHGNRLMRKTSGFEQHNRYGAQCVSPW